MSLGKWGEVSHWNKSVQTVGLRGNQSNVSQQTTNWPSPTNSNVVHPKTSSMTHHYRITDEDSRIHGHPTKHWRHQSCQSASLSYNSTIRKFAINRSDGDEPPGSIHSDFADLPLIPTPGPPDGLSLNQCLPTWQYHFCIMAITPCDVLSIQYQNPIDHGNTSTLTPFGLYLDHIWQYHINIKHAAMDQWSFDHIDVTYHHPHPAKIISWEIYDWNIYQAW